MQKAVLTLGKALLAFGVAAACISAGGTYSTRVVEVARGHGQFSMRRAVIPMPVPSSGAQVVRKE